jgi:putative chitinase
MMTLGQFKEATCAPTTCAQKFLPFITDTCERFKIDSAIRQLCFLAQVGHESGGLYYTEEIASGAAYEGRKNLGNTQRGDGVKFKGRGLIQITGRANYSSIGKDLEMDFISNPTLLGGKNITVCSKDQLKYAALSAGWFWNSRNLNKIADMIDIKKPIDVAGNLENFQLLTKRINGGVNGLADRLNRYKTGMKYF